METIFIYALKVNAALLIFYLLYVSVLKNDTFLRLKRWYFLSAIIFSYIYPFFSIDVPGNIFPVREITPKEEVQTTIIVGEPSMAVVMEETAKPIFTIPWEQIFIVLFVTITVVFALRFLWQLISILHIKAKSEKRNVFGINVYHLSEEITPFSFFKWIFVNTQSHNDKELSQILLHEQTHAQQWHSADVVLLELLSVIFWWNPIVWLLKRESTMNLEYLADSNVLQHGINSKDYQYCLLRLTYQETVLPLVNNFNVSQLKQRIMMMNRTKSPAQKITKYITIFPVLLLLITANSVYAQDKDRNGEIFIEAEKNPEFPGGQPALMKYLAESVKYPVKAQENNEQGRVITNFVIEKDGSIFDIKVTQGVAASIDAEAERIIRGMPRWNPAEQRGQKVRFRFTLPIVFRLQGESGVSSQNQSVGFGVRETERGKLLEEVVVVSYAQSEQKSVQTEQKVKDNETLEAIVSKVLEGTDEVFVVVEDQPEFPGGTPALMAFLGENVRYPKEAHEKGIQGRVIANFVIMKDGSISDVNIMRGVDSLLDAEAVRVLESMPMWKPGKQRGQPVNVRFTLPIVFRLKENTKPIEQNAQPSQTTSDRMQAPKFPGGESAYLDFLTKNAKYPVIAQENGIEGLVSALFSINSQGETTFVRMERSVDPSLDKEVRRIIGLMPKWAPAKYNGEATSTTTGISFFFRLQEEGETLAVTETRIPENAVVVAGYRPKKVTR